MWHEQLSVMLSGIYCGGMELADVRQAILAAFEARGETQTQVAERAGVRQGHLSKLLDLSLPYRELRARVLLNVIEQGLQIPLSEFFRQLEPRHTTTGAEKSSLNSPPGSATMTTPPRSVEPDAVATAPVPVAHISPTDLERIVRAVARGLRADAATHQRDSSLSAHGRPKQPARRRGGRG